jgi:mono/diheme cytochrome c family protein
MRCLPAISLSVLVIGFGGFGGSGAGAAASPGLPAGEAFALQTENPIPMSDESIKEGGRIYGAACRACHGFRGRGDGVAAPPGTKPANLTDAEWKYGSTDAELFKNIKEGIAPYDAMKPQKALGDNDIWNVINFIRSLSKPAAK